jgi:hypothetical protein
MSDTPIRTNEDFENFATYLRQRNQTLTDNGSPYPGDFEADLVFYLDRYFDFWWETNECPFVAGPFRDLAPFQPGFVSTQNTI